MNRAHIYFYQHRPIAVSFCGTVLALALLACGSTGNAANTSATSATLPIAATDVPAAATATPAPTSTPVANLALALGTIREALARQDYEAAATMGKQLYAAHPANAEVAQLLAQTYLSWGQARIAQAQGQTAVLREAFDHYADGLRVAPPNSQTRADLERELASTQTLLEAGLALDQLQALMAAQPKDLAAHQQQAEATIQRIAALAELPDNLPNRDALRLKGLLAVAQVEEQIAGASWGYSDKQAYLTRARELCTQASALLPDSPEAQAAQDCLKRLHSVVAPVQQQPPRLSGFRASVERTYGPSASTNTFDSCVQGRVIRDGMGVDGAVGNINNGPHNSFSWTSGADGFFQVCGLGASQWAVVLYYVPPDQHNLNILAHVWVNGMADQKAEVTFRER